MEEDKTMGKTEEDDSGEEKKEELAVGQDGCSYSYQQLGSSTERAAANCPSGQLRGCAPLRTSSSPLFQVRALHPDAVSTEQGTTGAEAGHLSRVAVR